MGMIECKELLPLSKAWQVSCAPGGEGNFFYSRNSFACEHEVKSTSLILWKPPKSGCFKLNFDEGKRGVSRGWGLVVCSCDGDIILADGDLQ